MYTKFFASVVFAMALAVGALAQSCGNPPMPACPDPSPCQPTCNFNVQYCCEAFNPPRCLELASDIACVAERGI
ncbi:hypothetical protein FB45DRAFT_932875 [Roridomyces roridus]|uniref:Uncharacterized protein n=1 Tax=Roridomyces roridus TaxID=1738132 RepID=A0AAD7FG02_9AGAR|nr:hypothetical protein FB45DRAFT_932875 [Roridomyces roridus]